MDTIAQAFSSLCVTVMIANSLHLHVHLVVCDSKVMQNADNRSPQEIHRHKGKSPVCQIDEPFFCAISGMETAIYDPTQAIRAKNTAICRHQGSWEPLRKRTGECVNY